MDAVRKEQDRFGLKRSLRTEDSEIYLIFHQESKRKRHYCAEIVVIQERKPGHFRIKVLLLTDQLDWKKVCYKNKAEEFNYFGILVGLVEDIVESWGGGSWYLEAFEGVSGEEYSGEV